MSNVQKFYAGKTIFITGVTGFLGHVLLSKLLCACPDIRCIYILMRAKKEKDVYRRFGELLDNPIFKTAKELNPDYKTKVKPISGDCSLPNLGICETDRLTIQNQVEVVFHVAATVKFDAPLRDAVYTNIRSAEDLLEMAKIMPNLKAFVYVSTAFSSCAERKLIEEKFYEAPIKANNLLTLVELLDDQALDEITPMLLRPHPNTYVYTKIVAEDLCREKGANLPISVFRPAIVIPTEKEPVPGWISNVYGPTGIAASCGMGIVKVALVDTQNNADLVPCDYVINALIASAYRTSNSCSNHAYEEIPIFNFSNSTTKFAQPWGTFIDGALEAITKFPFSKCVYLPMVIKIRHEVIYRFLITVLHLLPAFVIDLGLSVCHKKPRYLRLYRKIHKLSKVLSFFSTQQWIIKNDNVNKLWHSLSQDDRQIFYFNLDDLNVEKYFEIYISGVRLYILNDDQKTLARAITRRKRLMALHYTIIVIFVLLFTYWLNLLF